MYIYRPKFDTGLDFILKTSTAFICSLGIFLSATVNAAEELSENEELSKDQLVELHLIKALPDGYREYRPRWALRVGVMYEYFIPSHFQSPVDLSNYSDNFGGNGIIPLVSSQLGLQFSFRLGTISLDGIYGVGNAKAINGNLSTLNINKYGVALGLMLDGISSHPWIIPFGTLQQVKIGWSNSVGSNIDAGTTDITTGYTFGISLPLGLYDREARKISQETFGLKEAYLDIFGAQYQTSNGVDDPDFATDLNIGLGLRFIF